MCVAKISSLQRNKTARQNVKHSTKPWTMLCNCKNGLNFMKNKHTVANSSFTGTSTGF